ncbi:MAG TPA: hypothetical protein VIL20_24105 [Sandaracinaceae bacterium]
MTEKSLRFARFTVLASFVLLVLSLGGSLYEHLVLDTVWIDNPSVIRGASGGATRTYFWIPMHGAITLALVAALAATWKHRPARNAVLLGFGLYAVMRIWTFAYFVPLALEVESQTAPVLSPEMREASETWVRLSMLRFPLVTAAAIALGAALRRLGPSRPKEPVARWTIPGRSEAGSAA